MRWMIHLVKGRKLGHNNQHIFWSVATVFFIGSIVIGLMNLGTTSTWVEMHIYNLNLVLPLSLSCCSTSHLVSRFSTSTFWLFSLEWTNSSSSFNNFSLKAFIRSLFSLIEDSKFDWTIKTLPFYPFYGVS